MSRLSDSESSHSAAQRVVDRLTVSVSQTESELHRLQQLNSQQEEKIGHLNDDKTNLGKIELFALLPWGVYLCRCLLSLFSRPVNLTLGANNTACWIVCIDMQI